MADYSTIKGFTIQSLTADPYQTAMASGTWASGGNLNQERNSIASFGTQTAAVAVGGNIGGDGPYWSIVEEYNGSAWSEETNYPTEISAGGACGTLTAGLVFGGTGTPPSPYYSACQEYDGTNWTAGGSLNTARSNMASAGTQTAGLAAFGGAYPTFYNVTEEYDGSTWTTGNAGSNTGQGRGGIGSQTSALAAGGALPSISNLVESYDGSNWTAAPTLNTARTVPGSGGTSNTSGLVYGGDAPGQTAVTEGFDGTSWTELADLATPRYDAGGLANNPTTAQLAIGGGFSGSPNYSDATEAWSVASPLTLAQEGQVWYNSTSNVLKGLGLTTPAGAWSSGGAINSGRMNIGYAGGSNSAMIIMGGYNASNPAPTKYYTATESYNGASWTTVNSLQSASGGLAGMGTSTAAIETGGGGGALPYIDATELWDGTSWTETGNATNAGRETFAAGGSSTAAMIFGGVIGAPVTPPMYYIRNTEEYDGSSWSEKNDLNIGRQQLQATTQGTTTAMLAVAGELDVPYSPRQGLYVEEWDGTCWTEIANVTNSRTNGGGAGTSTSALRFGGSPVPGGESVYTEAWNGTSWSEVADLATGRTSAGGGNGVASSALYCGGKTLPTDTGITLCEEWAAGQAIQTFTAS